MSCGLNADRREVHTVDQTHSNNNGGSPGPAESPVHLRGAGRWLRLAAMVWVFAVVFIAVGATFGLVTLVHFERERASMPPPAHPHEPPLYERQDPLLEAETVRMLERIEADLPAALAQIEAELPAALAQIDREAAEISAGIAREVASTMDQVEQRKPESAEDATKPVAASAQSADFNMPSRGWIRREDYVPTDIEARYLLRGEDGLPTLRLVDAGDRLAVWSPRDGGVLINPKGPGLRKLGLYSTYARGGNHVSESASRGAPRAPGIIVELRRDPENEHDPNAVKMMGTRGMFGWVQRGRTPAVARRMDAGEDFAAVCLREGFFLVGARADLEHMLK